MKTISAISIIINPKKYLNIDIYNYDQKYSSKLKFFYDYIFVVVTRVTSYGQEWKKYNEVLCRSQKYDGVTGYTF